jgi:dephospho-CoA kinase
MITVALTGGIGSGKTTVAKAFATLGVPVYIADEEAKKLMNVSKVIRRKLIKLFGEKAYLNNELNRSFLAEAIFSNKNLLEKMNDIVHPKVKKHFIKWKAKQQGPYIISEVAIVFENDTYKNYDYIITVTAPEEERIARVIARDHSTKEKVQAIINNQWKDAEKVRLSDYVITNTNLESTKKQILKIHNLLLNKVADD